MKKTIILFTLIVGHFSGYSQESIEEAKISIKLANEKWGLKDKLDQNGLNIYFFKREALMDSLGQAIIPNISVVVEEVDSSLDVITYSMIKRGQLSFDVLEVYTHENELLDFKNAIAYKATYQDPYGEHTIYLLHAINNGKGIQIFFDALSTVFEVVDSDFKLSLKSIKRLD